MKTREIQETEVPEAAPHPAVPHPVEEAAGQIPEASWPSII